MQAAPYDFLAADDMLSQAEMRQALAAVSMWTADGMYAMLPYSAILLEAVPTDRAVPVAAPGAVTQQVT